MRTEPLEPCDHVSAADTGTPDGVYRVVGRDGDAVTLLRVGDADGRRVHAGTVATVGVDEVDDLTPAENPDGDRPLGDVLASTLETGYWSVRVSGRQSAANPLPTLAAVALLLGGAFGDRFVALPGVVFGVLVVAGSLGLASVGSGRL